MLAPEQITKVRRLLANGKYSQRKISRMTNVSRGTVSAIANGKRPDFKPKAQEDEIIFPQGPKGRCPECGAMVYLPCRLCLLKKRIVEQNRREGRPRDPRPGGIIALDLHGECRTRYEAIRAKRMRMGEWIEENGSSPFGPNDKIGSFSPQQNRPNLEKNDRKVFA